MRKRFRITLLFGKLLLWAFAILFGACRLCPVWAEGEKEIVDRLHGFAFTPQEGWNALALGNAILFHDTYRFVLVRAMRHDGDLRKVAKAWLAEQKAMEMGFQLDRFFVRKAGKGIVIVGKGLDYPFALLPMMAVNFGLLQQQPPSNYREVTAILPGERYALVVTFLFPEGTSQSKWEEMTAILRSLRFLPPQQMVKWRTERVHDAEVGMEAATMHVPEGFEFKGAVIRQGTKRVPVVWVQKGDKMLRIDHIDVRTSFLQTGFGGNANSVITVNGQSMQLAQAVSTQSEEDVIQLVLALWQGETGQSWTLKEKKNLPFTAEEARMNAQAQQMTAQGMAAMGVQAMTNPIKVSFVAESGSLKRRGIIQGNFGISQRSDWVAATQMGQITIMVFMIQAPVSEFETTQAVFQGVFHSWQGNPAHALSALERFTQENKQLNQMVRQMTQEQQDFNSRMATAWTNLLSDQTYVKDPQTGEISRVYKQSWETGGFWREPVFGDTLLGAVREGSKLEELLKSEGWRRMQESLEGFPQK
jgi:hypothetical protein